MSIIELLGGTVDKLRLQKILFLYSQRKSSAEYDFIPYKYGGYSFTAHADINAMLRSGILSEAGVQYSKKDTISYFSQIKEKDKALITSVVSEYGKMSNKALLRHTYLNFPFYAIRSDIAQDMLPGKLYQRIENAVPTVHGIIMFTIGYEGISLEKYLLKLIENGVKLLVDVRRNPLSMKFGFSKSLLQRYCHCVGIDYIHLPEVGIASEYRRNLESKEDYEHLFAFYRETTLNETRQTQIQILELLKKYQRIALTCFEADACRCHRSHLAEAIKNLPDFEYSVKHL
ncbi:Uncharacterized conserved protein, DUF488 family [Thermophagus xiamenensis]|uniref:Uncharacterized conserved protein, DUF488 family n=1 Tax=Thermophagus xiamenensis TaxID=385682 RepID=A0A1I2BKX4_9BACT|nr:Uncharacterized conserved protein, DUF488 family [Thermophagus xiamenensis]